jgi:hypothetical protein
LKSRFLQKPALHHPTIRYSFSGWRIEGLIKLPQNGHCSKVLLESNLIAASEAKSGSAQNGKRSKEPLPMPATKTPRKPPSSSPNLKIPELEHAKATALGTLASLHSRRAYGYREREKKIYTAVDS